MEKLAVKHKAVIMPTVHGSKPHGKMDFYDPFNSIGTTSWFIAASVGALVMLDLPDFNVLEDEDEKQRILGVRGRYRENGDAVLMVQTGKHGHVRCTGLYRDVRTTSRQQEMLALIADVPAGGWITGGTIAREVGCSTRNVRLVLGRFVRDGGVFRGRTLQAVPNNGYRLL